MINLVIQEIVLNPTVLYLEAIGICIFLLFVLFFLNFRNWMYKRINYLSVTYVLIMLCAISDLIWFFVDGKPEWATFNRIMQLVYLIIYPVSGWTWLCFCLKSLDFKKRTNFIIKHLGLLTLVATTVLNIMSLWNGIIFSVDANGFYSRGDLYVLNPGITFINLLLATVCSAIGAFTAKFERERKNRFVLAIFIVPVIAASAVQLLLPPGIPVMYFGVAISFLGVYMNFLDDQITEDKLTSTLNHFAFDRVLEDLIKKYKNGSYEDKQLWMIAIDIDDFKKYNSKNGYLAGDRALEFMGQVVKQTSEPLKAAVGRVGADTFGILIEARDSLAPMAFLQALPKVIANNNAVLEEPIEIKYTVSYTIYEKGMTRQVFSNKVKADFVKARLEKEKAQIAEVIEQENEKNPA